VLLSDACHRLLTVAAVIGREIETTVLVGVHGQAARAAVASYATCHGLMPDA
jgi:hypothetical protein